MVTKKYPKVGQVFELTLSPGNLTKKSESPIRTKWKYIGQKITKPQTRKFKLVQIDRCANWQELTEKLQAQGNIPEGQWLEVFLNKFGINHNHDKNEGSIGVADASWIDSCGASRFPLVDSDGNQFFGYTTGHQFGSLFRWLVEVVE